MQTRRAFFASLFVLTAVVAPVALDGLGAQTTQAAPIRRFMEIGPGLYRGGQPDKAGYERLRDMGIRTVVNFRTGDDERAMVEALGMKYIHIPVHFRWFGGELPEAAVTRFFAIVDDASHGPVFFHCKRGADRTGAFAALYRITRQGWSIDRAYSEARDVGMRWWYPAVKGELHEHSGRIGRNEARETASPSITMHVAR